MVDDLLQKTHNSAFTAPERRVWTNLFSGELVPVPDLLLQDAPPHPGKEGLKRLMLLVAAVDIRTAGATLPDQIPFIHTLLRMQLGPHYQIRCPSSTPSSSCRIASELIRGDVQFKGDLPSYLVARSVGDHAALFFSEVLKLPNDVHALDLSGHQGATPCQKVRDEGLLDLVDSLALLTDSSLPEQPGGAGGLGNGRFVDGQRRMSNAGFKGPLVGIRVPNLGHPGARLLSYGGARLSYGGARLSAAGTRGVTGSRAALGSRGVLGSRSSLHSRQGRQHNYGGDPKENVFGGKRGCQLRTLLLSNNAITDVGVESLALFHSGYGCQGRQHNYGGDPKETLFGRNRGCQLRTLLLSKNAIMDVGVESLAMVLDMSSNCVSSFQHMLAFAEGLEENVGLVELYLSGIMAEDHGPASRSCIEMLMKGLAGIFASQCLEHLDLSNNLLGRRGAAVLAK
eukprot:gene19442-26101_t